MENKFSPIGKKSYDINKIVKKASLTFGVDFLERNRKAEIMVIKAAFITVLWKKMQFNYSEIARAINLTHATVMHHVKKHEQNYKMPGEWSVRYSAWYDRLSEFCDMDFLSEQEYIFANIMIGRIPRTTYQKQIKQVRI